jgi:photosystem II stability/assembly factor-like uncharacterized protein
VDRSDANRVFVAALGHPYGANSERGVFRTSDGGQHWQKVLGPNRNTGAVDLVFDPSNSQTLYAALWQTRRTPWSVYPPSSGPGGGVYKSTDGGEHWTQLKNGLPAHVGRVGFAISAALPSRVYAIVDAEPGGGLYRSDDAGANWRLANADNRLWQRGWYFGELSVDPKNAERVYVPNTILLRSEDGGASFVAQKGDPTGDDYHALWIDPQDPARQILGTDQGAVISLNNGVTWSSWYNQPTGQFYRVATDNNFPYHVYGAQQDSGAASVPSRTTHGDGISMMQFRELTAGGESDNIAPDPLNPEVIYGGRVARLDLRTRQTRNIDPTLAYPDHQRRTWTLPLAFSPLDQKTLYFANQKLYRTTDAGAHWDVISPDLTRIDPGTPKNLDTPTAALHLQMGPRRGVIYAIAPSRTDAVQIWVGTDDGKVWRTTDAGKNWQDVTPAQLSGWAKVTIIDASPFDSASAYIAVDRHRLDDTRPYIYRTHNGGKTWELIVAGIASSHFVNSVRADPVQPGLLFAATERGVYFSRNDGAYWQALQQNLPRTSVRDLVVKNSDLVIATHGRGFWILDDISALRQLAQNPSTATRLFTPSAAIRLRPEAFSGTPMPKDEPMAPNPAYGAVIDYHLANAALQPVTLTIRDAKNMLVRVYSSADVIPPGDAKTATAALEWQAIPIALSGASGAHRFIWPLHFPPPSALAAGNAYADGAWAPPGGYTVELNVDGTRFSQPLQILPDPRVEMPESAYAEQFELALQIEGLQAKLAAPSAELAALQKALSTRQSSDALSTQLLDGFQKKLNAVLGTQPNSNPGNGWWLPPKTVTSLRFIGAVLGALESAVSDSDAPPSGDARTGLALAKAQLPSVLAACMRLQTTELDALNHALLAIGKQPLVPAAQ